MYKKLCKIGELKIVYIYTTSFKERTNFSLHSNYNFRVYFFWENMNSRNRFSNIHYNLWKIFIGLNLSTRAFTFVRIFKWESKFYKYNFLYYNHIYVQALSVKLPMLVYVPHNQTYRVVDRSDIWIHRD
jgi:hypothetical protein